MARTLNTQRGSSSVSIKIARETSRTSDRRFSTWSLTAAAPIEQSATHANLADLNGLADSFTLALKYVRIRANGIRFPPDGDTIQSFCSEITDLYRAATGEQDEPLCDLNNGKEYLSASRYAEFKLLFWDPSKVTIIWGGEGKLGNKEFKYIDTMSDAERKNTKTPLSAKVFLGFRPPNTQSLLVTMGAEYQRAYMPSDVGAVCPSNPLDDIGFVTCKQGATGGPVGAEKYLLFLETRLRHGWPGAGIAPRFTYDGTMGILGIDLPIFLFRGDESSLRGGIRLGWRSDTKGFNVGVFVGRAFSLFQ